MPRPVQKAKSPPKKLTKERERFCLNFGTIYSTTFLPPGSLWIGGPHPVSGRDPPSITIVWDGLAAILGAREKYGGASGLVMTLGTPRGAARTPWVCLGWSTGTQGP